MSANFVKKETRFDIAFSAFAYDKIKKMLEDSGDKHPRAWEALASADAYLQIARRLLREGKLSLAQEAAQTSRSQAEAAMRSLWIDQARDAFERPARRQASAAKTRVRASR